MKRPDIYQIISIVLAMLTVISLVFFVFSYFTGRFGRAAVQVTTDNGTASVVINGRSFGESPVYSENIQTGSLKVQLNGNTNSYSTELTPANGTLAIVTRDLGVSDSFSSGQNLWMEKTFNSNEAFISVVTPKTEQVAVLVDGVEVGKAPIKFSTKDLLKENSDGKYQISFKKEGYEEQMISVSPVNGYQLNIRVDMFPIPIPKEVSSITAFPEGVKFINLSKVSDPVFLDKKAWAKAINYFIDTRDFTDFGNYQIEAFDYFIDDNGDIYGKEGNQITPEEMKVNSSSFVAYLGFQDKLDLSDLAKESINVALNGESLVEETETDKPAGAALFKVKISGTGSLGYLRVREQPSTSGKEIGRVTENSENNVYEEKSGWYRIKLEDKDGWISSSYAKKLES